MNLNLMRIKSAVKRIFCLTVFLLLTLSPETSAAGAPARAARTDGPVDSYFKTCVVVQKSYALIAVYWQVQEVLNLIKEPSHGEAGDQCAELRLKYEKLNAAMHRTAAEIADHILADLENHKDARTLKMFSAFYKSKALCERQPLYFVCTPIVKKVQYLFLNEPQKVMASVLDASDAGEFEKQYFPGYGEADPYYYYRKGRELECEVLETYWKEITSTYTAYETLESIVTAAHLWAMYDDPDIEIVRQEGPFIYAVDGVPVKCYKVKYMTLATITTVSKRKFDLTRVWFELLRNKYSILMPSKWEVCGKTYEMHEFYTGNEVIIRRNSR